MNVCEPDPHRVYPLRVVVEMTGSSERKILFYCRAGVLSPARTPADKEWVFDEESVGRLRKIETLRQAHRMNWAAIRMIMGLMEEVETLRDELRFRR